MAKLEEEDVEGEIEADNRVLLVFKTNIRDHMIVKLTGARIRKDSKNSNLNQSLNLYNKRRKLL